MYPEPTLQERVAASLQKLGLRKIPLWLRSRPGPCGPPAVRALAQGP